ncbi:microfibril-associated glycoprotein 4-like isoform 2-T2 [Leptodactylus fuscus]|uniref:microfibril-associated glycoprotein 4-like isoform X2 n=1 Tax=Leptodactylus fuscus TaxID=238119 RepID=UPI003F4EECD4
MEAMGRLGHIILLLLLVALSSVGSQQHSIKQNGDHLCSTSDQYPVDCEDVCENGDEESGPYVIYPAGPGIAVPVYCDMTTDGGKWTVIQKRFNGTLSFFRGWSDYKLGFGRADSEYWLGLHNMYLLTLRNKYELRVELGDFDNNVTYAKYSEFAISPYSINPEEDGYTLHVDGFSDGGAGDSLSYHNGMKFSTYDSDRDVYLQNCASLSSGGFWYRACLLANLNGPYLRGAHLSFGSGIIWSQWRGYYYSLKSTEMKIRRQ